MKPSLRYDERMDFGPLRQVLGPLYLALDPAHREEHAQYLDKTAHQLLARECEPGSADSALVTALSYLLVARESVLRDVATRSSIEAFFVEAGWTAPRIRELFRALERLPDKPKSTEEKLVADAETLGRLGMRGFVRLLAMHAATGTSLPDVLGQLRQAPNRRVFTRSARKDAQPLRDELRELVKRWEQSLE